MNNYILYFIFTYILSVLGQTFDSSNYDNAFELSSDYHIYWNIKNDEIELALKVKTTGWIGFGIGESTSGSMPGADIVTGQVINGIPTIQDRFALSKTTPEVDDCENWELISGEEINGETILEIKRKLDTQDLQDRAIVTGLNRVLFAMSPDDSDTFSYHKSSRGVNAINFLEPNLMDPLESIKNDPNVFYYDFTVDNYTIPAVETTYLDTFFTLPIFNETGEAHIIAIEHLLCCDQEATKSVHHFVLDMCSSNTCATIWGWATGVAALVLPDIAGFRVGNSNQTFSSLKIQTHYNNPDEIENLIDNSGIRVYFTYNFREEDAGVIQFGDPAVTNPNLIKGQSGTINKFEYNCPSDCTSWWPWDINVFATTLHMHEIGDSMFSSVYRNGQFAFETNRVDYYDFSLQQTTIKEFVLKPGDRIQTHCSYKSRSTLTAFGPDSDQEMCLEFVYYWPYLGPTSGYCGFVFDRRSETNLTFCGDPEQYFLSQSNPTEIETRIVENNWGTIDQSYQCPIIDNTQTIDTSNTMDSKDTTDTKDTGDTKDTMDSKDTDTKDTSDTMDTKDSTDTKDTEDISIESIFSSATNINGVTLILSLCYFFSFYF